MKTSAYFALLCILSCASLVQSAHHCEEEPKWDQEFEWVRIGEMGEKLRLNPCKYKRYTWLFMVPANNRLMMRINQFNFTTHIKGPETCDYGYLKIIEWDPMGKEVYQTNIMRLCRYMKPQTIEFPRVNPLVETQVNIVYNFRVPSDFGLLPFDYHFNVEIYRESFSALEENKGCGVVLEKKRKSRIVGGHETSPSEVPWQASLTDADLHILCAGTIISKKHILTSAHCKFTQDIYNTPLTYALVGNITSPKNHREIECIALPHGYLNHSHVDDIAVAVLLRWLRFGPTINKACLPTPAQGRQNFAGYVGTVSGYGWVYGGKILEHMQKVYVHILTGIDCENSQTSLAYSEGMICAGPPVALFDGPEGFCHGDRGGPLTVILDGRATVIGVASVHLNHCGSYSFKEPEYYTYVPHYRKSFIKKIMKYSFNCYDCNYTC